MVGTEKKKVSKEGHPGVLGRDGVVSALEDAGEADDRYGRQGSESKADRGIRQAVVLRRPGDDFQAFGIGFGRWGFVEGLGGLGGLGGGFF